MYICRCVDREMIGMGVGVDEMADAQAVTGGQGEIAVDLAECRVDPGRGAGLLAADQAGTAPAGCHGFRNHRASRAVCFSIGRHRRIFPVQEHVRGVIVKPLKPVILLSLLLAFGGTAFADEDVGIGPWRLGMSKEQVEALVEQGPYKEGEGGKLETTTRKFAGNRTTTSFVMKDGAVSAIEVQVYDGKVWNQAKDAALDVYDLFAKNHGGANVKDVADKVDRKALEKILDRTLGTAEEMNKQYAARQRAIHVVYDMVPLNQPAESRLHAQWVYLGKSGTYAVFLYQDKPKAEPRDAEENIIVEKLSGE